MSPIFLQENRYTKTLRGGSGSLVKKDLCISCDSWFVVKRTIILIMHMIYISFQNKKIVNDYTGCIN